MTTQRAGRNEPCPCGSGRKYKSCCEGTSAEKGVSGRLGSPIVLALAAFAVVAAVVLVARKPDPPPPEPPAGAPILETPGSLTSPGGVANPPITPASSALQPTVTPMTPGPQPPGPVPEGKVWSAEHGHWHDAAPAGQGTSPMTISPETLSMPPATPMTPAPQPPGPVPEGKVWSAEHGHWHDANTGLASPP